MFDKPKMFCALLVLGFVSSSFAGGLSDPACKPLSDALDKLITMPYHLFTTHTGATGNKNSETIYTADSVYVLMNGKWHPAPDTRKDMAEMKKEQEQKAKTSTCKYVRDEAVNGEAAALYSTHDETEVGKIDSEIWVSKSKDLIVRQDIDIDVGGAIGKSKTSSRFEYNNVQAPQIAK
jgi:hypothetical protein